MGSGETRKRLLKDEMAGSDRGKYCNSPEYNALITMTEDLCNALPISDHDLLPRMISNRVISFQEKIEIRGVPTDRGKVQLFISKLSEEMKLGENERFYKFLKTMKKSPKCSFLVERMERWISHYKQLQLSADGEATPPTTGNYSYSYIATYHAEQDSYSYISILSSITI